MKADISASSALSGQERSIWLPTWPRLTAPAALRGISGSVPDPAAQWVSSPGIPSDPPAHSDLVVRPQAAWRKTRHGY